MNSSTSWCRNRNPWAASGLSGLSWSFARVRIEVAAVLASAKPREVVVELGSLSSEIKSGVLTVFVVLAAMMFALAVMVYIQARKAGRWMATTLNRQIVNLAPGPSRDLVRMRARIDRCLQGARSAVDTATANGEAVGDLSLLCGRLEAVGTRLHAQLEAISTANLSPRMLNATLTPLRSRVDAFEGVATDVATIAATSIADVHGVELDAIKEEVDDVRHLVSARTVALRDLSAR
jgi:hypothetical protein